MSRYIDADKALNDIECIDIIDCTDIDEIFIEVEKTIDEQPTADVVEVVRCKDCKYRGATLSVPTDVYYNCNAYNLPYCKPDDYCSYGEIMGSETNDR